MKYVPIIDDDLMMDEGLDNDEHVNNGKEAEIYGRLMKDAQKLLYPECDDFSKLSFILKSFQIKCVDGMKNKALLICFNCLRLCYLKVQICYRHIEARKMITDLGFGYEKIEIYGNDCMLF